MPALKHVMVRHNGQVSIIPDVTEIHNHEKHGLNLKTVEVEENSRHWHHFDRVTEVIVRPMGWWKGRL